MSFKPALAFGFLYPVSLITFIGGVAVAFLGPTYLLSLYIEPSPDNPLWPLFVTLTVGCVLACMFIAATSEVLRQV